MLVQPGPAGGEKGSACSGLFSEPAPRAGQRMQTHRPTLRSRLRQHRPPSLRPRRLAGGLDERRRKTLGVWREAWGGSDVSWGNALKRCPDTLAQMINNQLSVRKRNCAQVEPANRGLSVRVVPIAGGRYFLRLSGATPVWLRSHRACASSAPGARGAGGATGGAGAGASTSPSRSSRRVRARCGWRR